MHICDWTGMVPERGLLSPTSSYRNKLIQGQDQKGFTTLDSRLVGEAGLLPTKGLARAAILQLEQ